MEIVAEGNFFGGPAKYGIMIHAAFGLSGRPTRIQGPLTPDSRNNIIDGATLHPALITFTNARATVLPAELNPKIPLAPQPDLSLGVPDERPLHPAP